MPGKLFFPTRAQVDKWQKIIDTHQTHHSLSSPCLLMFKSHFSQQSTPIHGFLTPFQPQTVHTSPLPLVYFMICHNVSWRIMIFSWYCISWYIMIPYSSKHLRLYLKCLKCFFWGVNVQTSPNWRVFGALIMIFSWDFMASKATPVTPVTPPATLSHGTPSPCRDGTAASPFRCH